MTFVLCFLSLVSHAAGQSWSPPSELVPPQLSAIDNTGNQASELVPPQLIAIDNTGNQASERVPLEPTAIDNTEWTNMNSSNLVPCNISETPLQIETSSQFTGGDVEVKFKVKDVEMSGVKISLSNPVKVSIMPCTDDAITLNMSSHLFGAKGIVWTVATHLEAVIITSNDVVSLEYDTNVSTKCHQSWNTETDIAVLKSEEPVEFRLKPSHCTKLHNSWKNLISDSSFPLKDGESVEVRCPPGHINLGDDKLTCNTNLYKNFEYGIEPGCVQVTPGSTEVTIGSSATLSCTVSSIVTQQQLIVRWMQDNREVTEGVETGPVVDGVLVSTLTLSNVTHDDSYLCLVEEEGGSSPGSSREPTKVSLAVYEMSGISRDVLRGGATTLSCVIGRLSTSPKIEWKMKYGKVVKNDKHHKIETATDENNHRVSTLSVTDSQEDVAYTCEVTPSRFPTSPTTSRHIMLNTYLMEGLYLGQSADEAMVSCELRNLTDEMDLTWWHGNAQISTALHSYIEEEGIQRSILVVKASSDTKSYKCRVKSVVRPGSPSAELEIQTTSSTAADDASLPAIISIACVALLLAVALCLLAVYTLAQRRRVRRLTFRVSTRQKLDSMSNDRRSSGTVMRNPNAPRDIESLRNTLNRKIQIEMSEEKQETYDNI